MGDDQAQDPRMLRTRAQVLESTRELAGESGLAACTFDSISERSGVARSTLYRHWSSSSELLFDAFAGSKVERVVPDTGSLRDDMLAAMLELGHGLEHSEWGAMVPQMMAVAAIDEDMAGIQRVHASYHLGIDVRIIDRAKERGEVDADLDTAHAATLFAAPIFYRRLIAQEPIEDRWVVDHVERVTRLLRPR